jgi:hypothetical protein
MDTNINEQIEDHFNQDEGRWLRAIANLENQKKTLEEIVEFKQKETAKTKGLKALASWYEQKHDQLKNDIEILDNIIDQMNNE